MITNLFKLLSNTKWFAIIWSLLILIACSIPGQDIPDAPVGHFDKIVHMGMFGGFTFLWILYTPHKYKLIVLTAIIYGLFIECYQNWMPINRSFDWWDLLFDTIGAFLGLALAQYTLRFFRAL